MITCSTKNNVHADSGELNKWFYLYDYYKNIYSVQVNAANRKSINNYRQFYFGEIYSFTTSTYVGGLIYWFIYPFFIERIQCLFLTLLAYFTCLPAVIIFMCRLQYWLTTCYAINSTSVKFVNNLTDLLVINLFLIWHLEQTYFDIQTFRLKNKHLNNTITVIPFFIIWLLLYTHLT